MKSYDGPKLQASEVAIIKPYDPLTMLGFMSKGADPLIITKIDGMDLEWNDKCEVLPGKHIVSIEMPIQYMEGPQKAIIFEAEAGHVYTVYGKRVLHGYSRSAVVWIVDDTTGKVVAKED
jgi:hypothetical protein